MQRLWPGVCGSVREKSERKKKMGTASHECAEGIENLCCVAVGCRRWFYFGREDWR